jgi:DNA-binding CsgD family transcriptional regulator
MKKAKLAKRNTKIAKKAAKGKSPSEIAHDHGRTTEHVKKLLRDRK